MYYGQGALGVWGSNWTTDSIKCHEGSQWTLPETYNGVTEPAVSGRVTSRTLLSCPGVVEDEERSHRPGTFSLGVREKQTTAE